MTLEDALENIDIGGPTMLRAAAKNFEHVAPVSRPEQYPDVVDELRRDGSLSLETRRRLAAEAFATTALYESILQRHPQFCCAQRGCDSDGSCYY